MIIGGDKLLVKVPYSPLAVARIYIAQLEDYDNDLFVEQILSRGDPCFSKKYF